MKVKFLLLVAVLTTIFTSQRSRRKSVSLERTVIFELKL